MNISPWIASLNEKFSAKPLSTDIKTDITIIGGGISGVLSAYFILKHTDYNICILDAGDFGFAATGHNSGYMVAGFDNSMQDLVDKFGEHLTRNAHVDINSGWYRFFEIYKEIPSINNYFEFVVSKSGFVDHESFVNAIEEFVLATRIGIFQDVQFYALKENIGKLPDNLKKYVEELSREEIEENFDVVNNKIHAGYSMMNPVAMMNSCQLVQDILKYLSEKYSSRIQFFSNSKVDKIDLENDNCKLKVNEFEIQSSKVVLCTNAFQIPTIVHKTPEIRQVVNYLLGFVVDERCKHPESFFYQMHHPSVEGEFDYVYGTKRHFMNKSLTTFGSTKDTILKPESNFTFQEEITAEMEQFAISEAVKYVKFQKSNPNKPDYAWQGMMAYTDNNLRIVGPSIKNPNLIYNIGCNGIGIVPAFFSGDKIARILKGETFEKSVFDPVV